MNRDTTNEWRVVQVNRKGIFADQIICIAIDEEWTQEFALMLNATHGSDEYKFEAYPPGKALWEPKRDRIAEDYNRAMKIITGE